MASGQTIIDSLEFVRTGGSLSGSVSVAALERLADVVASNTGSLEFRLSGERDDDGKPCIDLQVNGSLTLRCQRCLAPLRFDVDIDRRLILVKAGEEWPEEDIADEGIDAIEAGREMVVQALVEDEVLLALPIVPRHEVCRLPLAAEDEHRPSPFAVLAKLKDH